MKCYENILTKSKLDFIQNDYVLSGIEDPEFLPHYANKVCYLFIIK